METHSVKKYRKLNPQEIAKLENQDCSAEHWDSVQVADPFAVDRIKHTRFSGKIFLGTFSGCYTDITGLSKPCGISNAVLHNVTVGNNCIIRDIHQQLANYSIGDCTEIHNVGVLAVSGESSFGVGTEVAVINEGGGREVPIYDTLSAHTAYLIALYRHRRTMIEKIETMVSDFRERKTSGTGFIGEHVTIENCKIIRNVNIGDYTSLEGAGELANGTIRSCRQDPAYVGVNVIAKNFILCEGGKISDNTIIENCFIGQATELSKQYSAENSLFFANCGGFHGEACSLFAGPYTVTHHKSTLLIACLVSFLNAGSGSNQSNHLYKLGPKHQGIILRGSKTASDSYMLWPMKVGAFTLIMGRHYANSDTSEFPFSYLIEHDGESLLIPAVNLRSIGTIRDSRKWRKRDKRKAEVKFDHINFHLLSPYTVQSIKQGQDKLQEIKLRSGHSSQLYYYNGVKIRRSALENGIEMYRTAEKRYLGNIIVNFLRAADGFDSIESLRNIVTPVTTSGIGKWLDIAGLIAPKEEIDRIIHDIENGTIHEPEALENRFSELSDAYEHFELAWVIYRIENLLQKKLEDFSADDFHRIISEWIDAVEKLDMMRCRDAEKEFAQTARVGYALDDGEIERDLEYQFINGDVSNNSFISELKDRLAAKQHTAAELLTKIESLR